MMLSSHQNDLIKADFEIYSQRYSSYGTLASFYLWWLKDGGFTLEGKETKNK